MSRERREKIVGRITPASGSPGRHRLVRSFINVVRWQVVLSAMFSFDAAGSLAVTDLPKYARLIGWIFLLAFSLANTVLLYSHRRFARKHPVLIRSKGSR